MKQISVRMLDLFIPSDIRDFDQSEELTRARALTFILECNMALSVLAIIAANIYEGYVPPQLHDKLAYILGICVAGYLFALFLFKYSGQFVVCGNLFGLTTYSATMTVAIASPQNTSIVLVMLVIPVVVSLVANHVSAIAWLALLVVTPRLITYFTDANPGILFFQSWFTYCVGLYLALTMQGFYLKSMRHRLNEERSQFEFAAAHDPLTGLANRATFHRRLQESIDFCDLHQTRAALLYIDLDKFKPINDTYGHQSGDVVLTRVAKRLQRMVRRSDTVARLGGDEFAILFPDCNPADIIPLVEQITTAIREPVDVFGNCLTVDSSIGMVVYPDDGQRPEQLSQKADQRMYDAKRQRAAAS